MEIPKLYINDILTLKKSHPCGGSSFKILRLGSDVKILCLKCNHDMSIDRVKLEKSIKKIIHEENVMS